MLQYVAVCCSVLQCVLRVLFSPQIHFRNTQCVVVCCSVLQCVAVCFRRLQYVATWMPCPSLFKDTLYNFAVYCSVLQ